MITIHAARRRAPILLAALLGALLLAACGSSSSSSSSSTSATSTTANASAASTSSARAARRTALRQCLAQHGVTLPARPAGARPPSAGGGPPGAGGGLFGGGGAGRGLANNPTFAAAFRACGAFALRGGARRFQLSHAAITTFVACVRTHGYPSMPNPNFSGSGPVFPASIRTNQQFVTATKPCASLLVRPGATATAPGPTTGG